MADLPYTSEIIAMLFGWDDLDHVWFAIIFFVSSCRNNVAKMVYCQPNFTDLNTNLSKNWMVGNHTGKTYQFKKNMV